MRKFDKIEIYIKRNSDDEAKFEEGLIGGRLQALYKESPHLLQLTVRDIKKRKPQILWTIVIRKDEFKEFQIWRNQFDKGEFGECHLWHNNPEDE